MVRRPPRSALVPYPTLVRSRRRAGSGGGDRRRAGGRQVRPGAGSRQSGDRVAHPPQWLRPVGHRSEEHTSELQSRQYLVCRLLLEKKKIASASPTPEKLVTA